METFRTRPPTPVQSSPIQSSIAFLVSLLVILALSASAPAFGAEPVQQLGEEGSLFSPAALYGADVRSVAVHPEDPDTLFAGTAGGHLYVSRDGGTTWVEPRGGQPLLGWVVAALHFDPNRPGRLWAALWGVWGGGLVAYTDSFFLPGESVEWKWNHESLPGGQIYSMALVPGKAGWLYIGTRNGVYGSRDGGESWRHLTGAFPRMRKVTSLLVNGENPDTVYAGSWQRAYRSDDGGKSWRGVFEGMLEDSEVFSLTPVPGSPGEMWASTCGWVYRTGDGGGRWQRHKEGFENRRVPSFAVLPNGRLLAGTVGGAHLSSDDGKSWKRITGKDLAINAISVHADRPWRVVLGTEGSGVWISKDGGLSFSPSTTGMTHMRVVDMVAVERASGAEILAAVTHAGPAAGIHSSIDAGRTFQHQLGDLPTILDLAVSGERVYAATESGLFERRPDYSWHRLPPLEKARVEGVVAEGDRMVAWTAKGFYERSGESEVRAVAGVGNAADPPRGAALGDGASWLLAGDALVRVADGGSEPVSTPVAAEGIRWVNGELVLQGDDQLWARGGLAAPWRRLDDLGAEETGRLDSTERLHPTGDVRYSVVVVDDQGARLLPSSSPTSSIELPLPLSDPAREVTAALLLDRRILLATLGHGVLGADLDRVLDRREERDRLSASETTTMNPETESQAERIDR